MPRIPTSRLRIVAATALALGSAGCGGSGDAPLELAVIADPEALYATGLRLPSQAQQLRAATAEGLVARDENAQIIPGLARTWIVADDGRSYIFRLRADAWPDGRPIRAREVVRTLRRDIARLHGTSLGLDLAIIDDVRAMADAVVEFRLKSPSPDFLQLLAQPELAVLHGSAGDGALTITRRGTGAVLRAVPPDQRGLPQEDGWRDTVRPLVLAPLAADAAIAAFDAGRADAVLGGRFQWLPDIEAGALSRGTARIEAADGLFGLAVARPRGFLDSAGRRLVLSLALDRDALIAALNLDGWTSATRIAPPQAGFAGAASQADWAAAPIAARRAEASRIVAAWRAQTGFTDPLNLAVALPQGSGADRLLRALRSDYAAIGITLVRADAGRRPDLVLVDTVARFTSLRWYLDQFACSLKTPVCSPEADALVREALVAPRPRKDELLAQAEAVLSAQYGFVPFGQPLRWSLVRSDVAGFATNERAFHPLPPMTLKAM